MFIAALISMFPITDNATPTVILVLSSGGAKVDVRLYAVVVLYRFQGLSESSLTILFTPGLLILRGTSFASSRLLLALPIPRPFYF